MSPNIRGKCTEDADRYNKYNPLLVQIPREGNNTCSLYSVGGIFDKTRAHTLSPSFLLSPRRGRSFLYTVAPCSDLSRHPRCLPHPSKRKCPINLRRISKRNPKSKRLRVSVPLLHRRQLEPAYLLKCVSFPPCSGAADASDAPPPKRGRGRPKGSKNKKSGGTSATAATAEAGAKRKRGRPPKVHISLSLFLYPLTWH
jgi:hypothetical protein